MDLLPGRADSADESNVYIYIVYHAFINHFNKYRSLSKHVQKLCHIIRDRDYFTGQCALITCMWNVDNT